MSCHAKISTPTAGGASFNLVVQRLGSTDKILAPAWVAESPRQVVSGGNAWTRCSSGAVHPERQRSCRGRRFPDFATNMQPLRQGTKYHQLDLLALLFT